MLKPSSIAPVPEGTRRIARAAFRKGNPLLKLRDELGAVFADVDFADLFPKLGQPGLPPWRLALVTLLQFRENLPDRQAADAVRARIDWKYLLGLELTDPGFDHSVLCEFRSRLLAGGAEERLLGKLLEACRARGLLGARRRQRTDSTRVLASIRALNRLELVGETLRAALNELATTAPDWLREVASKDWYGRYAHRVEDGRLPRAEAEREAYARTVGEDGFALLDLLDRPEAPEDLRRLAAAGVLRRVWERQFVREGGAPPGGGVRRRRKEEPQPAGDPVESPYDPEARYRTRSDTAWVGYLVHARRKLYELAAVSKAPIAAEAVRRIDRLFAIERDINGRPAAERLAAREERAKPLVGELEAWLRAQHARVSRKSETGKAIAYALNQWKALTRFLGDGRICLSNNAAERALRGVAVGRRNWTFAGSDRGGERAAAIYTLVETAKLNGVDPQAWLADVLARLPDHPAKRIDELLPWSWTPRRADRQAPEGLDQ